MNPSEEFKALRDIEDERNHNERPTEIVFKVFFGLVFVVCVIASVVELASGGECFWESVTWTVVFGGVFFCTWFNMW